MDVLVTGGRGFVGMNVARTLARKGATVWIADRGPRDEWVERFLAGESKSINHVTVDLAQSGALEAALPVEALDAVVHAAAVTATTEEVERHAARDIVDSNVGGAVEALRTASAKGARRFVYVSSPSAIGDAEADGLVGEDVVPRPSTLYGITKLASEQMVARWSQLHDLEAASVRIAQPYGPGERATGSRVRTSPIWEWLQAATNGDTLATGPFDRARDWTFVDDTAEGIARIVLAEGLPRNLYHLSAGVQASVAEVIAELRARFGALSCELEPGPLALNPNISGPGRPPLDVGRFVEDFGWKPATPIGEGMRRYIDWWDRFRTSATTGLSEQ